MTETVPAFGNRDNQVHNNNKNTNNNNNNNNNDNNNNDNNRKSKHTIVMEFATMDRYIIIII